MPYDPTIALRAVQPQIDFGGAVQNAMAFRNAQQVNQLNQLKLAQEQQAMQQEAGLRNYLAQSPDLSAPETQRQLIGQYGAAGMDVVNKELQRRQFQSAIDKAGRENVTEALGTVRDMYAGVLARHADNLNSEEALKDYLEVSRTAHNNPFLGEALKTTGASLANTFTEGQTALESGTLGNLIKTSAMSADQLRQSLAPKQTAPTELEKLISLRNVYKVGTQERTDLENKIKLETTRAPAASTNITVKTGEEAATAFSKELGQKVAGELDTLNTKAQSAKSSIETSQLLRPLLENKDFISGTLGDARLIVAKTLGLSGADETQAFFAGIGKQVAENIKAFGSGTAVSDTDLKFAQSIVGGSKELTPSAIKQIMELNDKYSQMAIDKYNSRKKFLSQKNPTINDYYEDITSPSKPAAGGGIKVTAPNGKTYTFADQKSADVFKANAGIK